VDELDPLALGELGVRSTRVPARKWLLVAIFIAAILLILLTASREYVQRQLARVPNPDSAQGEKNVLDAEIPQSFSSKEEMFQAVLGIVVPGCSLNGKILGLPDGSTVWLESIEIPREGKDRCVVFRERDGKLLKADDFVYDPVEYKIDGVQSAGDQLSYLDKMGQPVPVTRLQQRAPKP
jgi:hypothetical protein